ncbi:hypothetical protein P9265_01250 [Schinkia azotoformans]|uniref:hypothetical protein n=1 Tax=Schinkia azotoformans TaxID=1454 RepID=UPI002E2468D6|nr:hypothetical protein [Schinkia azotoformans]
MQLNILGSNYEFTNELSSIDLVLNKIVENLDGTDFYLSHLLIDGVELFSDFDSYIAEYIEYIQEIRVEVLTIKEFLNEIFSSAEEYLLRALPEVEILTNEFYQNSSGHTWEKLQLLLEGLQWLNQMILTVDQEKLKPDNWNQYIEYSAKLAVELKNLEEGIINQDNILIADIIQYEINPLMCNLKDEITSTIDAIGVRKNIT